MSLSPSNRPDSLAHTIVRQIETAQPDVTDISLINSSRFVAATVPKHCRTSSISLHFDAGSRREGHSEHGGLHFFEHLPASAFRMAHNGENINDFADQRGWNQQISINREVLSFSISCPDFDFVEACRTLTEILNYPERFYRRVFKTELGRITGEFPVLEMDPGRNRQDFEFKLFFSNTGYDHPVQGTIEQVRDYSFEKIMSLGLRFLSANNLTVGVSSTVQNIDFAQEYFNAMAYPGEGSFQPPMPMTNRPDWSDITLLNVNETPLERALVVSMFFQGPTDYDPRERFLLGHVIAKLEERLQDALSYDAGLTYGAGARGMDCSNIVLTSASYRVNPESLERAHRMAAEVITKLPGSFETDYVQKEYLRFRNIMYRQQNLVTHEDTLSDLATYPGRTFISDSEKLRLLEGISVRELQDVARRYFKLSDVRFVAHGSNRTIDQSNLDVLLG